MVYGTRGPETISSLWYETREAKVQSPLALADIAGSVVRVLYKASIYARFTATPASFGPVVSDVFDRGRRVAYGRWCGGIISRHRGCPRKRAAEKYPRNLNRVIPA